MPFAHGGDGGGSLRIPASECGIIGLKPSRGRVSKGPNAGETWMGATIEGFVSRTVRDTAALLDAIAGGMPGDPYVAPPPLRPFVAEVGAGVGPLRIGFLDQPPLPGGRADRAADGAAAVARALRALESLGHRVEDSWPVAIAEAEFASSFTKVVASWTALDVEECTALVGRPLGEDDLEPDNLALAAWGRSISSAEYLSTVAFLQRWSRRVVEWWSPVDGSPGFDLLVTPTLGGPPPELGYLGASAAHFRELMQYTSQFNITGQPAISLPLHWNDAGLPIGVQLVAAPWREDVLLRVAAQLELALPWGDRTPPVHA